MKYVKQSDDVVVREDGLIIRRTSLPIPEWLEYEEWAKTNTVETRFTHQELARLNDNARRRLKHLLR